MLTVIFICDIHPARFIESSGLAGKCSSLIVAHQTPNREVLGLIATWDKVLCP